jgi:hypothetical protein
VPAIYFMESVVEAVSAYLGLSPDVVKPLNFYTKGQTTPYGQPLPYFRYTCDTNACTRGGLQRLRSGGSVRANALRCRI